MCRNIKTLHGYTPPATADEMRASALQYVRKLSGTSRPSQANAAVFEAAVEEITGATERLLAGLTARVEPRTREAEAEKAKDRGRKREAQLRARYGSSTEAR
jgi:hypothetical protein